ncbi:MAG TPA: hypothetical protein VK747_10900 [Blastocatellia bacterium]|nr:hypothetical protein [Blastocatellia bacterium]
MLKTRDSSIRGLGSGVQEEFPVNPFFFRGEGQQPNPIVTPNIPVID